MGAGIDKEQIKAFTVEALQILYSSDIFLISDGEQNHNHEIAIVHRFAHYIENIINGALPNFNKDFDMEYNRNLDDQKRDSHGDIMRPDFIIHQRGSNDNNILVIEFKTWWNTNQDDDIRKIKEFTDKDGAYRYLLGATVFIEREKQNIVWYE